MAWLSGWTYRRQFNVKHPSGALTDYQIPIRVGYNKSAFRADIVCDGLCKFDFSDIRFTSSDGSTLLYHFMEDYELGNPNPVAIFWIKLPSIGTSATTFYMYFGNSGASDASDGLNTFDLFDHFDDGSLDGAKWTNIAGSGVSENGTKVTVAAGGAATYGIDSKTAFGLGYAVLARVKSLHSNTTSYSEYVGWRNAAGADRVLVVFCNGTSAYNYKFYNHLASVSTISITSWLPNVWATVHICRPSSAKTFYNYSIFSWYKNGGFNTNQVSTNNLTAMLATYGSGSVIEADWMAVRKLDDVDPVVDGFGHIEEETPISASWLSDWAYRIRINVSYAQLAGSLLDFPIAIKLGSSVGIAADDVTAIFDELGANSLKIAFTEHDGTTQLYAEVASWDNANEKAVVHVKAPHLSGIENTYIYLYYDSSKADNSSYVGVTTSTPAKKVWDRDFSAVFHFNEAVGGASSIYDSTANMSHATPVNTPTLVDAQLDKGLDFDKASSEYCTVIGKTYRALDSGNTGHTLTLNAGMRALPLWARQGSGAIYFNGSSDQITIPDHNDWHLGGGTGDFTIEAWVFVQTLPSSGLLRTVCGQRVDSNNQWAFGLYNNAGAYSLRYYDMSGGSLNVDINNSWIPTLYIWYHVAVTREGNDFKLWVDGTQLGATVSSANSTNNFAASLQIGKFGTTHYYIGYMDELRISTVCRYSASFTPQIIENFESDANTSLLAHFDIDCASTRFAHHATDEAVFKLDNYIASGANNSLIWESTNNSGYSRFGLAFTYIGATDTRLAGYFRDTDTGTAFQAVDSVSMALSTWFYTGLSVNVINNILDLAKNDSIVATDGTLKSHATTSGPADDIYISRLASAYHDGIIDEIRRSLIDRSAAWRYATYKTLFDILLTYEDTELLPTTAAPTTVAPTTLAPTTLLPTTLAPTTLLVSTPVPTTTLTTPAPSLGGGRLVNAKLLNKLILLGRLVQ